MNLASLAKVDRDWIWNDDGVLAKRERKISTPEVRLPKAKEKEKQNALGRVKSQSQLANPKKEEILAYIEELWGTEAKRAKEIFYCESGFQEKVISRTSDVGVAQINLAAHWTKIPGRTRQEKIAWLQDYRNNLNFAYALWKRAGWQPWVCSRIKKYKYDL